MNTPPRWLQSGLRDNLQLLVIEPLFEEANRCRRLIAQILRTLDAAGIDSAIAELPGTGESITDVADVRLADWRGALASYRPRFVASFRGGALLDDASHAERIWRFAPESGARIVRDLRRTALSSGNDMLFAGHALTESFLADLEAGSLTGSAARTVRLASDPSEADVKITGSPLWRRAEPGEDPALAAALADDLINWI